MQVIIIGCGKVGSSLARELIEKSHVVVIIESDTRLLQNVENLDCVKINGVPIDKDVLKSAGIEHADALCAVTPDDNMNLMTAQVAKEIFNVPKVIARIFNPRNKDLFEEFGLDTVCSTSLTVSTIYRELEEAGDEIDLTFSETEVRITTVRLGAGQIGMEVTDLSRQLNRHIAGIIRNGRLLIAMPGMKTEKGDSAALLTPQSENRGK